MSAPQPSDREVALEVQTKLRELLTLLDSDRAVFLLKHNPEVKYSVPMHTGMLLMHASLGRIIKV